MTDDPFDQPPKTFTFDFHKKPDGEQCKFVLAPGVNQCPKCGWLRTNPA
jgi:hypothetical protein